MDDADGLIDAFVRGRDQLLRYAAEVPADQRTTPFVGHWHLMDVLAHLVGWDYTNVDAIHALTSSGSLPDFYGRYDPGWESFNQQLVERYGTEDWDGLLAALAQSQAAVTDLLRSLAPEALQRRVTGPGRERPVTIAGILRAAIRDEQEHTRQIRAFVESQRTGR